MWHRVNDQEQHQHQQILPTTSLSDWLQSYLIEINVPSCCFSWPVCLESYVGTWGRFVWSRELIHFHSILLYNLFLSLCYVHGNTACLSLTAEPECENSPGKSLPYFLSIPVLVCVQCPLALLSYIICAGLSNLELAEMSVLLCFAKNIVLANTLSWNCCSVVCAEIKTLDIIIFWCLHGLVLSKEWDMGFICGKVS